MTENAELIEHVARALYDHRFPDGISWSEWHIRDCAFTHVYRDSAKVAIKAIQSTANGCSHSPKGGSMLVDSIQDTCRTAQDAINAARQVTARRKAWVTPTVREIPTQVPEPKRMAISFTTTRPVPEIPPMVLSTRLGQPLISEIIDVVCLISGIAKNDILSIRRDAEVCAVRQVAMLLCKILTTKSLPEIGRGFGGRDHTTILHGVRKMQPVKDDIGDDAIEFAPLPYLVEISLMSCRRLRLDRHKPRGSAAA